MAKQIYNWGKVKAGDIISFRYKGKQPIPTLTSIIVLNTKLPYKKKDGSKIFQLVGLKLEEEGTVPLIKNKVLLVDMLQKLGEIRVDIEGVGPRGATPRVYNIIKKKLQQFSIYRTYDYDEAKKSAVFLEPIDLPKQLVESLTKDETVVEDIVDEIVEEVERKTSVVTGADTTEEA